MEAVSDIQKAGVSAFAAGLNRGMATIDFGAFPGTDIARVTVPDTNISNGSIVQIVLRPVATALHSEDEHMMLAGYVSLSIPRSSIVAGVSFDIVASVSDKSKMWGTLNVDYAY